MKLYGKKFAKRSIDKRTRIKTESRDAILWSVDWNNRICNVKIQGSNELVAAHFPQNLAALDPFMKPGNAVRIAHRGGIRGFIEVVGHGMAIPTPVSGDSHPDTSDLADGVVSGMRIFASDPASMSVDIEDGTYRINGTLYSLQDGAFGYETMSASSDVTMNAVYPPMTMGDTQDYPTMDAASEITMNEVFPPMTLGEVIDTYELDAAPSGNKWRYDCFYVGTDGIITYLKGTESGSEPTKPSIPADTVLIGEYILLWTGVTEITGQHIGMKWEARTLSGGTISAADTMAWDSGDDYPEMNVAVSVQCQYGWNLSGTYTLTLKKLIGTGQIYSAQSGYDADEVSQDVSGTGYTFKYQRDQTVSETSPIFYAEIVNGTEVSTDIKRVSLLDNLGAPID